MKGFVVVAILLFWRTVTECAPDATPGSVPCVTDAGRVVRTRAGRSPEAASVGTLVVWDTVRGRPSTSVRASANQRLERLERLALAADGAHLIEAAPGGPLRVTHVVSGKEVIALPHWDRCFALSPDGRRLMTGNARGRLQVHDTTTGSLVSTLRGQVGVGTEAAFSADGDRLVTLDMGGTAHVWDVTAGRRLIELKLQTWSSMACFSPDPAQVAFACHEGTVQVWNVGSGTPGTVLRGHSDRVTSVAFSPDGARIVTASSDPAHRG